MHRDDIQQQLLDIPYGVIRAAEEWKGGGNTPLAGHPDFPSEVKYLRPLSIVETQAGVDKDFADDILASLRVLFAPTAVRADIYKPLLITDGSGHKCIMQVLFISRAPTFTGQCMFYALHDSELWANVPITLPHAFTISSAADSDSILRLSDWAAQFALAATAPLTYQRIEVDWSLSSEGRLLFEEVCVAENIDVVRENNRAQAAAMRAVRLMNAALAPWCAQPKRRKAVVKTKTKPQVADDGSRIAEQEPEGPEELVWKHASDESSAETDHGLDDEFEPPRVSKDCECVCLWFKVRLRSSPGGGFRSHPLP